MRSMRIKQKLGILNAHYLEIIDQSYLHAGHMDADSSETHFYIKISADILKGKPRIKQHTLINKLLDDEFNNGLHALSIKVEI